MVFQQSIFYYSYYIPFSLHRNHMGCENSQLIENLPDDREAIEKMVKNLEGIRMVPQEDKQNCQNGDAAFKSEGNRTIRKEKQSMGNDSSQVNEQTNILREAATWSKGHYSAGAREGSALSKFAVPRSKQLPDLVLRKQLDNRQQNIQVEENQGCKVGQLREEGAVEDLTAAIVVDNADYGQRDLIYENCNRECISEQIRSEQLGKSQIFAVREEPEPQLPHNPPKQQQQSEAKMQRLQVQCFASSLMPIAETTTKNVCLQGQHRQGCSCDYTSQHSLPSSQSCEPLIIILTEKGEAISHQ